MKPPIQYTKPVDGVSIAFWTMGDGAPIVIPPPGLPISDLQLELGIPEVESWYEDLGRGRRLVRYDPRGFGLSKANVEEFSLEAFVRDLEAVVEHVRLAKFALFGCVHSAPLSIEYAARHPERVSHLMLWCGYAQAVDFWSEGVYTLNKLIDDDWHAYTEAVAFFVFGSTSSKHAPGLATFLRESIDPDSVKRALSATQKFDVSSRLKEITVPTLVLHRSRLHWLDQAVARQLAAEIPGARLAVLEGDSWLPHGGDKEEVLAQIRDFLGVSVADPTNGDSPKTHTLIAGLDVVDFSRFRVVGDYMRHDEATRNMLKDVRQEIRSALIDPSGERENHLIWAAPGSGKTYFVNQVAAELSEVIFYLELNLAKCTEDDFLSGLKELDKHSEPSLCLVDEIDAKQNESWPYESLLPYLERKEPFTFVLAGSGGNSVDELKQGIAARNKGPDLLNRIPGTNEYAISPLGVLDRVLVVLSQFRQAGRELRQEIEEVEKLGLYYVAQNPLLSSARQLRKFAVRAVKHLPPGETRVKYDDLFRAGDRANKMFWNEAPQISEELAGKFVLLEN